MLLRLTTPTEHNDLSVMRPSTDESATHATVSVPIATKANAEPLGPAQL